MVSKYEKIELKCKARNYLTDCDIKLSSKTFEEDLINFFLKKGINNISLISIRSKMISIIFDMGEGETMAFYITKEIFK